MSNLTGLKLKAAERRQRTFDAAIVLPVDARVYPAMSRSDAEEQLRDDVREAYRHQANLERKAIAAARKAARSLARDKSCQICGRGILANTGVIAHHGYERPEGWYHQTASCAGARFAPYEESCDRLREVLAMVRGDLARAREDVANLETILPAILTYTRRVPGAASTGYDRRTGCQTWPQETVEVAKPVGFADDRKNDYNPKSYSSLLAATRSRAAARAAHIKATEVFLALRLKAWKVVA